jgi:hypothetical protein
LDPRGRGEGWPRAGGTVVLAAQQGPRVAADVTSATSHSLLLRLAEPLDAPDGTHALIEYVVDARAYRLSGQLEAAHGELRFVASSRPVFLQRREHVRASIEVVMVLASDDSNLRVVGRTCNLSVGGALGEFAAVLTVGERLRFALVPRVGSEGVKGACRVVRVNEPYGLAVQFENVTPEVAGQLAEFILRHRGASSARMASR